jgi:hypothetical protein
MSTVPIRQILPGAALALLLAAGTGAPAFGQAAATPQHAESVPEWLGRQARSMMDRVGLGERVVEGLVVGSAEMMRSSGRSADDFAWLMDIAGYKVREIETSVGLIPEAAVSFGQARELTEGDRNFLERQLERHARRNPGLLGIAQRAIVRTVADASELGAFEVDKVEVTLLPLPSVRFALSPSGAPLGPDAARLMRAIDRLGARVNELAERSGAAAPEVAGGERRRP